MRYMRKDIILPGLAVAGGAAGFALRKWQLSAAYHPETGLFTHGFPATYALLGKNGYQAKKAELDAVPAKDPRYII